MSLIEKLMPTLQILIILGICSFSINRHNNKIQLSYGSIIYSLIGSIIYISIFAVSIYSYLFANNSIQEVFSNIYGISVIFEIFFSVFAYFLFTIFSIRTTFQHVTFFNQLNQIYLKSLQIFTNKLLNTQCYLVYQIILLFCFYVLNVKFIIDLHLEATLNNIVILLFYLWGIVKIYLLLFYVHYLGSTLIRMQNILIQKFRLELNNCDVIIQLNFIEIQRIWDNFNDLMILFIKTFGSQTKLSLIHNCMVVVINLYAILISFSRYNSDISFLMIFQLNLILMAIFVTVYLVIGQSALSTQVYMNLYVN